MPSDPRATEAPTVRSWAESGVRVPAGPLRLPVPSWPRWLSMWTLVGVIGCDEPPAAGPSPHAIGASAVATPVEPAPSPSSAPPAVASDPWAEVLASRVLVEGRLGAASKLVALETIAEPDAKPVCAACSLAASTKLVVAAAFDPSDEESLRDLDAIHRFYADNGLAAFVVLAPREGDRLITPPDPGEAIGRALALRDRLRLAVPVHVPARVDDGGNRVWDEYYAVGRSPLVLLVGPDDRVLFSAAAPPDWGALDEAIVRALEGSEADVAKSPPQ